MGIIRKKKQLAFIFLVTLSLNICGCAAPQDNVERRDVSVSDNGVKQGKKDKWQGEGISSEQLTYPFATKNCIYMVDKENAELIQTDLQRKHKKSCKVPEGFWDATGDNIQISDEHICYEKDGALHNYWGRPVIYDGRLYFSALYDIKKRDMQTIYQLDIEEWKAEKLSSIVREALVTSELVGIKVISKS